MDEKVTLTGKRIKPYTILISHFGNGAKVSIGFGLADVPALLG
jgi:hypothetical protein